jgi:hypothetical protein
MYKTMTKGLSVKKSWPWAFCRNKECPEYGENQFAKSTQPPDMPNCPCHIIEVAEELAAADTGEPDALKKARQRIKQAMGTDCDQYHVIGLAIAILIQEMGQPKIANSLIDEYGLEAQFGIKKRT